MKILNFDWDQENVRHLARHQIERLEAEQVFFNGTVDLDSYVRNGEERIVQLGETDSGRALVVVSTARDVRIRVVTAWPANQRLRRYLASLKRSRDAGRAEANDFCE